MGISFRKFFLFLDRSSHSEWTLTHLGLVSLWLLSNMLILHPTVAWAEVYLTPKEARSSDVGYSAAMPFILNRRILTEFPSRTIREVLDPRLVFQPKQRDLNKVAESIDLDNAYGRLDILERAIFDRALALDQCHRAATLLINQVSWNDGSAFYALLSNGELARFLAHATGTKAEAIYSCLLRQEAALIQYFLQSTNMLPELPDRLSFPNHISETILSYHGTNIVAGYDFFPPDMTPMDAVRLANAITLHGYLAMSDRAAFALLEYAFTNSGRTWVSLPPEARHLHRILQQTLTTEELLSARQLVTIGLVSRLGDSSEAEVMAILQDELGLQ